MGHSTERTHRHTKGYPETLLSTKPLLPPEFQADASRQAYVRSEWRGRGTHTHKHTHTDGRQRTCTHNVQGRSHTRSHHIQGRMRTHHILRGIAREHASRSGTQPHAHASCLGTLPHAHASHVEGCKRTRTHYIQGRRQTHTHTHTRIMCWGAHSCQRRPRNALTPAQNAGATQAPHRAVRELGFLPDCAGVFISRWHHGSPAHRYGLYALHWCAGVCNGCMCGMCVSVCVSMWCATVCNGCMRGMCVCECVCV